MEICLSVFQEKVIRLFSQKFIKEALFYLIHLQYGFWNLYPLQ